MNDYNDRKHSLLLSIIETIADAVEEMEVDENTEAGTISVPVFRYQPQFEFTEEDMRTIRDLAEEEGMDFTKILGEEEEE